MQFILQSGLQFLRAFGLDTTFTQFIVIILGIFIIGAGLSALRSK